MKKKCVKCGAELKSDCAFCTSCGAKQPPVKQCPHCGDYVPVKAQFCTVCGKELYVDEEYRDGGMNWIKKSIFAVILLGIIAVGGYMLWQYQAQESITNTDEYVEDSDSIEDEEEVALEEETNDAIPSFKELMMLTGMGYEDKASAMSFYHDQEGYELLEEYEEDDETIPEGLRFHALYFGKNATAKYDETNGLTLKATGNHAYVICILLSGEGYSPVYIHDKADYEQVKEEAIKIGKAASSDQAGYRFSLDSETGWYYMYWDA